MARRPTRNDQYVFISYRREDSQTITGRIYDWLSHCTQSEKIFMDIDSIELGVNFVERITESIPKCRAMLVVIGPDWLDEAGQPSHYVRLEIEKALDCRIQIIPLLVEGASLPPAADLPEGIRPLVSLNAATVRAGRDFPHDMQDVTRSLGLPDRSIAPSEGRTRPSPQVTRRFVLTATGAIGLTALGVGIQRWLTSPESSLPYLPRAVLYLFEATSASLYAVNVSDGSTRWSYSLGAELTGFAPLNIGTTVFMGTSEGILYAFDGDQGSVRWQQSLPGSRVNGAFGSRGAVYVNAGPRAGSARVVPTVYALSAGDGAVRWQVSNFTAAAVTDTVFGFVTERRTVNGYMSDRITHLSALNPQDGEPIWSYRLPEGQAGDFSAVLGGQALYLSANVASLGTSETGTLHSVDIESGLPLWQVPTTGKRTLPVPVGDTVYVSSQLAMPAVLALSADDGTTRWRFAVTTDLPDMLGVPSPITVVGDSLLFASDGVYELDIQSGDVVSHYLSGLGVNGSQPLVAGDMVYVTSPGFDSSTYAINTYATVYAVSRRTTDRTLVWSQRLPSGRVDDLTVVGDEFFFSSGQDGVFAVDRLTGSTRWRFQAGEGRFTGFVIGPDESSNG